MHPPQVHAFGSSSSFTAYSWSFATYFDFYWTALEKHQTASNSKSENPIFFFWQKPGNENEIEQKPQNALVTKTEKPI